MLQLVDMDITPPGWSIHKRFILEKNKARLEQETENLEKRKIEIQKDISIINEELQTLENVLSGEKIEETAAQRYKKTVPKNPMKAMTIDY